MLDLIKIFWLEYLETIALIIAAGYLQGPMDLIAFGNRLKEKGAWWDLATTDQKDHNGDGKVDFLENNFSNDAWHRFKLLSNFCWAAAVSLWTSQAYQCYAVKWKQWFAHAAILLMVFSFSFIRSFTRFNPKKS
jgi:hypothetical protein